MKTNVFAVIPDRIFTSLGNSYEYGKAVLVDGEEIVEVISVVDIPESVPRCTPD